MKCKVCDRNPERMNNHLAECSHVDCPHRPKTRWVGKPYWLKHDEDIVADTDKRLTKRKKK